MKRSIFISLVFSVLAGCGAPQTDHLDDSAREPETSGPASKSPGHSGLLLMGIEFRVDYAGEWNGTDAARALSSAGWNVTAAEPHILLTQAIERDGRRLDTQIEIENTTAWALSTSYSWHEPLEFQTRPALDAAADEIDHEIRPDFQRLVEHIGNETGWVASDMDRSLLVIQT